MKNRRIIRKTKSCLLWAGLSILIWFANCDATYRMELVNRMVNWLFFGNGYETQTENMETVSASGKYLEDMLQEYCLAGELVQGSGQKDQTVSAGQMTDEKGTDNLPAQTVIALDHRAEAIVAAMSDKYGYMREKLTDYDYMRSNFYVIDSTTSVSREELNGQDLASMDLTIDTEEKNYKVLIYHTHGTESFKDSEPGKVEDTVIGLGDYLTELLEENYGVAVYHDTTAYDMTGGELDRSAAYDYAREGVQKILAEYPSIEVVIDLHRDGVSEDTYLITEIDGKKTAQVMFLNGVSRLNKNGDIAYLANPYKTENLAFSLQMYLTAQANYDSYVRKIFVKGYRYNLDLKPRSLLVEVGSQTNTVEEAKNAMEPLAAILYKVLSGK